MSVEIEARCTQCGSEEFGDPTKNNNTYDYTVPKRETNHGGGKEHGSEQLHCPTCDRVTVHNRAGSSVPKGGL